MGSGSAIRAGRVLVELTADDSKLQQGLRRAQAKMRKFAKSTELAGRLAVTTGAAIIAPATIAAKLYSSVGDELDKMSQRTGVSVEALSELGFAASQSGSNLKTLEKGFKAMQTNLLNAERGLSTSIDNLDALGLSIDDLKNKSPEEQFKLIADKIADIQDPSKKAAVAIGLLGRSGQSLIPLLSGGRKGMEDLQKKARDLGLTISTDAAKSAAIFTDKMDILTAVLRVNVFEIGAALAPAIIDLSKKIVDIAKETVTWIRENQETIVSIAKLAAEVTLAGAALIAFGSIATAVSNITGLLSSAIGLASTAVKGFNTALKYSLANPEVAVFAVIATAAVALSIALSRTKNEAADLAKKMTKLREAGDRQRATDLSSLDRLKKLSNAGELNARQMTEAKSLLKDLTSRYGDLGVQIEKNTVKMMDQVATQKKLNEGLRKSAITELNAELKTSQRNIFAIEKKIENAKSEFKKPTVNTFGSFSAIDLTPRKFDDTKLKKEIAAEKLKMAGRRARRDDLLAGSIDKAAFIGGVSEPVAPPASPPPAGRDTERLKKLKAELAKINEAEERKRQTAVENEIADIEKSARIKIALIKQIAAEEKAARRINETDRLQGQITDVKRGVASQIVAAKEKEAKRLKAIDDEAKAAKQSNIANEIADIEKAGKAKIDLIKKSVDAGGKNDPRLGQITDIERGVASQIVATKEREAKRLKAIDDEAKAAKQSNIANEIAGIEKAGKAKIDLIKKIAGTGGKNDLRLGQITNVELERNQQIVQVKEREAKRLKAIDDEAKATKLADSKNIIAEEKRIADEIARVRIEQTLKGAAKERALLALERQQALADAKETGIDTRLIDKLFRLKNQAIKAATAAAQVDVRQRVVGSFNVRSVISGSVATAAQNKKPEEDTAKSTEKTAKNTARIISIMERLANDGGLFFG